MTDALRILLADHDEPFRQLASDALRSAGFVCDSFRDSERAAAAFEAGEYDLAVASVSMPGNRDFELLRKPAKECGGMPMIILARPGSLATAVTALRLGAADYLVKPLSVGDLVAAVRKAAERAQALRTVRKIQHVIGASADWFQAVGMLLATPGPLALPSELRSALGDRTGDIQPLRDVVLGRMEPREFATLSPREREVVRALVAGRRVREIARSLGIAVNTGRKHVKAILRKVGVHSQAELVERFRT